MERKILVTVVLLLAVGSFAQAQDSALHGSFDFTYQSQYLWRGFSVYGEKSAIQPSLDLDLFGTGLGINVMGHMANSSGYEDFKRWDYNLYYQNMLSPDEAHALMYRVGWVYYNYPQLPSQDFDLQEIHAVLSLPKAIPAGVVPSYYLVKLWPSSGSSLVGNNSLLGGSASGWLHIFRLDYPLTVGGILPDTPEQVINFHAEATYNDGFGWAGQVVDHDWSHAVFGVSTGIDLVENLALTPGVYHQITMDKSVNDNKTETWATLSLTFNF
ncbi:MAG: TorF family putative porin [Planctomycetota bacterium]|jgi:hypothetical protein